MRGSFRKLILGNYYLVWYNPNKKYICQFINTTRCGFNFLNINTQKKFLKYHIYPSKNKKDGDFFFINNSLKIIEYVGKIEKIVISNRRFSK